jgi:predicted DNA-binding protein with PD1-like motif
MPQAPTSRGAISGNPMRHVVQPGPPAAERIRWVEARGRAFSFRLEAGIPLLEAARRGFASAGFTSGVLNFSGGALAPFAYVMPSLSKTGEHAAFYSDTFQAVGTSRLKIATMTFGVRDNAPFFHCHALWTEGDGRFTGGHILPEATFVAESTVVQAFGIAGAAFEAVQDTETNFKLFEPVAASATGSDATSRAFVLRLRPNQDFATSIEGFCQARGIISARLRGGVGSIIGARFSDGRAVEPFVTEMAVSSGEVKPAADGSLAADLHVALVDHHGGTAEGVLTRGDNPVLMTMELVLEVL